MLTSSSKNGHSLLVGAINWHNIWKITLSTKSQKHIIYGAVIPPVGISLQKCPYLYHKRHLEEYSLQHYLQEIQTEATQNLAVEWINNLWCISTMKYFIQK